ncbi:hypothetical protein NL503_29690, partial [Klebsiella pneumoniae]|nr:hypothetical protein [Klebsiella pneumoniae]
LALLRREQQDNPHFRSLLGAAAEPARGTTAPGAPRRERSAEAAGVAQLVAQKADLLFALAWKPAAPAPAAHEDGDR